MKYHPTLARHVLVNDIDKWANVLKEATNPTITLKGTEIPTSEMVIEAYVETLKTTVFIVNTVLQQLDGILKEMIEYATEDAAYTDTQTKTDDTSFD